MFSTFTLALLLSAFNCRAEDKNESQSEQKELANVQLTMVEEIAENQEIACKDKLQITAICGYSEVQNYGLLFENNRVWTFDPAIDHPKFTFLAVNQIDDFFQANTSVNAASTYLFKGGGETELHLNNSVQLYHFNPDGSNTGTWRLDFIETPAEWAKMLFYGKQDAYDETLPDCISNLEGGERSYDALVFYQVFNKPKLHTRVVKQKYSGRIKVENHDGIFGPKIFKQSLLKQLTKPCRAMEVIKYKKPGEDESFMLLYVDDEYLYIIRDSSETTKVKLTELFNCNKSLSGRSMRKMKRKLIKGAAKAAFAGAIIKKLHPKKRRKRKFRRIVRRIAIGAGMLGTGALMAMGGIAIGLLAFCMTH